MHVAKLHIQGNSLAGLYIVPLEHIVLVGHEVPEIYDKDLAEIFGAPIHRMTIAGTSLLGVFLATDGEKLLVPHIIFAHEEEQLKKLNISYLIVPSDLTCTGNNILLTKKGVILHPEYLSEAKKAIAEFLGCEVRQQTIADLPTVGSLLAHNLTHGLITHEAKDAEILALEKFLGLTLTTGTVNMGSTQIASGVAVNSKGFVIGDASGGPELMNADQALGFIE